MDENDPRVLLLLGVLLSLKRIGSWFSTSAGARGEATGEAKKKKDLSCAARRQASREDLSCD